VSYEFVSKHSLQYSGAERISIPEIADSLVGMDRIVRQLFPAFRIVMAEADLVAVHLDLDRLQAGSLLDIFDTRFIFKDKAHFERWATSLRKRLGVDALNERLPFVGPMIVAAIMIGGTVAVERMIGKDESIPGTTTSIQEVRNSVIILASSQINIEPAALEAIIHDNTSNAFNLASNACRVIHPAKLQDDASIIIDDSKELTIPPAAILETPSRVQRSTEKPGMVLMENEPIRMRALDLDNPKRGWAVVIPSVSRDKRIRLEVAQDIDRNRLLHRGPLMADIEVYYKDLPNGDQEPVRAFLRAVH
jgi:hypothetical protein